MWDGYKVHTLKVDSRARLNMQGYMDLLSEKVAIVSVMWANNESGTLFPVEEMAMLAKSAGVMDIPFTAADGTVRFSLSRYNRMEEIDRVIEAVPPIVAQLRKLSPYWGEDGPLEDPEKAFAPAYA